MWALPGSEQTQPLSVASSGGDKQACLPHPELLVLGQDPGRVEMRVGCQGFCLGLEDKWFHQFN